MQVNAFGDCYKAHVVNGHPNNSQILWVHCFSRDREIGFHNLCVNEEVLWHFKMNLFGTTKFCCNFWWDSKQRGFAVFDSRLAIEYCGLKNEIICWWLVKADGFFILPIRLILLQSICINWMSGFKWYVLYYVICNFIK